MSKIIFCENCFSTAIEKSFNGYLCKSCGMYINGADMTKVSIENRKTLKTLLNLHYGKNAIVKDSEKVKGK